MITPPDRDAIKRMLPNLPNEPILLEGWLINNGMRYGWPDTMYTPISWVRGNRTLEQLKPLIWSREEIWLTLESFVLENDRHNISERVRAIKDPAYTVHDDGATRAYRCLTDLKQKGAYPPILERVAGGYQIFDGNHRLGAYFYLRGDFGIEKEKDKGWDIPDKIWAWVATSI